MYFLFEKYLVAEIFCVLCVMPLGFVFNSIWRGRLGLMAGEGKGFQSS